MVYCRQLGELNYIISFGRVQVVVSLSSGSGIFTSAKGMFRKILGSTVQRIDFIPFNEEEFQHYKELNPGMYNLRDEVYRSLTNYNPLLLSVVSDKSESAAKDDVKREVRDVVDHIVEKNDFKSVEDTLPKSMEMLAYVLMTRR